MIGWRTSGRPSRRASIAWIAAGLLVAGCELFSGPYIGQGEAIERALAETGLDRRSIVDARLAPAEDAAPEVVLDGLVWVVVFSGSFSHPCPKPEGCPPARFQRVVLDARTGEFLVAILSDSP